MFEITNLPAVIALGKAGENLATEIQIDVSEWITGHEDAVIGIVLSRADGVSYPVMVETSSNVVSYSPLAADLVSGYGKLEVRMYDGDVIKKSTMSATFVSPSIEVGEAPDPQTPDWVQTIIDGIIDIKEHGVTPEQIEAAVTEYLDKHPIEAITREQCEQIVADYVTAHKDELKGDKGDQGIPGARGADGKDGTNGKDGYTPIKGVDYFDGQNGKDGKDGVDGKDYVITEADYSAIADVVLTKLPTAESEEF